MKMLTGRISNLLILTSVLIMLLAINQNAISAVDDDVDLSQKNIGLKNPDDIVWPYGEEYKYEMTLNGPFSPFDQPRLQELISTYESGDDGGTISESYTMNYFAVKMSSKSTYEFRRNGLIQTLRTQYKVSTSQPGVSEDMLPSMDVQYTPERGKIEVPGIGEEVDVPGDGFFFVTGVDNPGMVAFLFSRIDLESDVHPEVWVFNGGDWLLETPMTAIFRFKRLEIYPLDEGSSKVQKWWEKTRDRYDDWTPGDDVTTYIMDVKDTYTKYFIDGDIEMTDSLAELLDRYPGQGPYAAVYVDSKNRVVRIEQPSGLLSDAADLKLIGGGGSWFKKKKSSE